MFKIGLKEIIKYVMMVCIWEFFSKFARFIVGGARMGHFH